LGLNNKAYEVVRLAKPQEVRSPGVSDQDNDPLALSPTVKLYKLPDNVNSWVHLDVNSNAINPGQDTSKNDIAGETGPQWDGSESKTAAKARVFNRIGRKTVWQVDGESRDLSDDDPRMQMATLSQHCICGPPDDSGSASETFCDFIGPEIEQGELSGNLSEENGLTLIGTSYRGEEDGMEVEVVPDSPGTNNQPVVCWFD
jgi:hypothetical protein